MPTAAQCRTPSCTRAVLIKKRQLCRRCYRWWQAHGQEPTGPSMRVADTAGPCRTPRCPNRWEIRKRRLCLSCYRSWQYRGGEGDDRTCRTPGCGRPVYVKKRQLCHYCYSASRYRDWEEPPPDGGFTLREKSCDHCGEAYTPEHPRQRYCLTCAPGGRATYWLRKYGATRADLQRMWDKQQGRCKICGGEMLGKNRHVDHCHQRMVVRGLLCATCNHRLAVVDDPDWLTKAIGYLRESGDARFG